MGKVAFSGRIVIVGFGSIGQGVLPLLLANIDTDPSRITIVTANDNGRDVARSFGVRFVVNPLTPDNYVQVLDGLLQPGDFLLNLSVEVSSADLVRLARRKEVLYLDTCIEPWPGGYTDPGKSPAERSNYALREEMLTLRQAGTPTAVVAHGANPGLVSHLVKQALLTMAADTGLAAEMPQDRQGWARLMRDLGVKVVHVAERDTQCSATPKRVGEFVNTWSIDGFVGEGQQPAELGWGSHERHFPADGVRHAEGCGAAIFLDRPGASVRVRTWTPNEGPFHGFLITHNEAISIADYFSLTDEDGRVTYRPTCHYAYHPCDDAVLSVHELAGKAWEMQPRQRLLMDEIDHGMDELGVLLAGSPKGAYWYGSQLTIAEARALAPHNNATSLQVTASVLGGVVWAMENPRCGVIEPEHLDFRRVLEVAGPYLGPVVGRYTDWTPLSGRGRLFAEDIDSSDPWQFKNIRVA